MAGSWRRALAAAILIHGAAFGAAAESLHVRGRVYDADTGAPIAGARVALFVSPPTPALPMDPERLADTERIDPEIDAEGRFDVEIPARFGAGSHVILFAQAPGHAERDLIYGWLDEKDGPALTLGKENLEVDVPLRGGRTLEGVVDDAEGKPVSGVRVDLLVSMPNYGSHHTTRYGEPFPWAWPGKVVTDAKGRWSILGFPFEKHLPELGGRWVLTFQHDRMAPVVTAGFGDDPDAEGVVHVRTTMAPGLSLRGTVLDEAGKPIAGARIRAGRTWKEGDPDGVAIVAKATTDDKGQFDLGGLDARTYELEVADPDHLSPSSTVDPVAKTAKPLVVRLQKGFPVRCRVLRHDGRPLPGAWVNVVSDDGKKFVAGGSTKPDGTFVTHGLARGPYKLRVHALVGFRSVTAPSKEIQIRAPERRALVVEFMNRASRAAAHPHGTLYLEGRAPGVTFRAIGGESKISLGLIAPGSYSLRVVTDDFVTERQPITVTPGPGRQVFRWQLSRGFDLTGRVTDEAGNPIGGATIEAVAPRGYGSHRATSGKDGRYRLGGLNDRGEIVGSVYYLFAHAPGYTPVFELETFAFYSPFKRTHDFTLEDGGTVRGRVARSDGTPMAGATVRAYPREFLVKVPVPVATAYAGADGRYVLEHVPSGGAVLETMKIRHDVDVDDHGSASVDFTVP